MKLSDLQIKRRQLENELASLFSEELGLVGDLQNLEKTIILQLEEEIKAKKTTLSGLEAQKSDLQKKLSELKSNEMNIQKTEEQRLRSDDVAIVGVVENTPIERIAERIAEDEKRKGSFFWSKAWYSVSAFVTALLQSHIRE